MYSICPQDGNKTMRRIPAMMALGTAGHQAVTDLLEQLFQVVSLKPTTLLVGDQMKQNLVLNKHTKIPMTCDHGSAINLAAAASTVQQLRNLHTRWDVTTADLEILSAFGMSSLPPRFCLLLQVCAATSSRQMQPAAAT